ncbi:MAG: amidotransferase [bacterium]|nr:MAG: amidotransferase [bacterium]
MKIHILQHVSFENPGTILDWAEERKFPVGFTQLFQQEKLPETDEFDLLVVMGGPMSLADTKKYPWLDQEKAFLKKCLYANKKMIGICLGAQLLAETLGAKVFPGNKKEIGWFPIQKNDTSDHEILKLFTEETLPAFHWHGDTFNLPGNAVRLFLSQATGNQAFVWNNQVFALQFHWEVKPENVHRLLENSAADLTGGPFVQQPEEMLANQALFIEARKNLFRFLDFVVSSGD